MTDPFLPATALAAQLRAGTLGCAELLEFTLDRVARLNPQLNAVIVQDAERARARARALDNASDKSGIFFGVPMTVKESFDFAGHPTTWGFAHRRDHRAGQDALALQRLEAAGAIIYGKTNVPVGLADWQSFNPIYGATNNPWDPGRTPGGSSGGSAAAIAAGFGGLELGSDIAGSIRVPAHFCGVYGHKPSWGLVSLRGHTVAPEIGAAPDISVIGPLARSTADLTAALDAIAGPDPQDSLFRLSLPPARVTEPRGLRVAVWAEQSGQATDRETVALIHQAARHLQSQGAIVDDAARPAIDPEEAFTLFLRLLDAVLTTRMPPAIVAQRLAQQKSLPADAHGPAVTMLRATGMSHMDWVALDGQRVRMRRAWTAFFQDWDVLLCPVAPTPAFAHQQDSDPASRSLTVDGKAWGYDTIMFWPGLTGLCHLPATVAPIGLSSDGLPIGVQIVGPLGGDRMTLAVSAMLEAGWRRFVPPSL